LTELHGGRCRIDSEVDMGTLVTVFLPSPPAASAPQDVRKVA
jgi:signal transduction histidine kinase